jgi:hypothetical protein
MGLSNYSPSSRLSQAGVCTSSTRPASPYEGQVIYETDTDKTLVYNGSTWIQISTTTTKGDLATYSTVPDRLSVGSNNRYLRANSAQATGLEWSTNQVGLELVASTTFSNSNNLLMNGVFTATYDNYVVFFNLTSVSSATTVFMRLANGTSVDASSIYLYGGFVSYMGSGILTAINNGGASTDWPLAVQDGTYGYGNTPLRIEVVQPRLSYRTAIFSSGFQPVNPLPYYRHLGGVTSNTTSYDGFTIVGNNSSFTLSGTISVYGYRNS